ncbi:GtrA family protein [Accumulibacter sp.]|uniref:GtrA family protein n=1 Tax=Accumulibacter sp. TaxID=2053492 RepID=UPI001A49D2D5|nr:GtrA family protein [Accumulibacter sp.]MBL8375690.1 GtrA family protein [Accumulibacter sp.]
MSVAPDRKRFARFLAAGALNSVFGFGIYSVSILLHSPVWAALLIANITGVVFNFLTTGGYAFRTLLLARFPRFAAAYLGLYLVNWKLIDWLGHWVPGAITAQAILTVPLALFSYFVMVRFVFAPIASKDPPSARQD